LDILVLLTQLKDQQQRLPAELQTNLPSIKQTERELGDFAD
jgi:hypothetical protein